MTLIISALVILVIGLAFAVVESVILYQDGTWDTTDLIVYWLLVSLSSFSVLFSCYVCWLNFKG